MIIKVFHLPPYFRVVSIHHHFCSWAKIRDNISFKNVTKSVGPSIDPWGTPDITGNSPEVDPPITTHCFLSLRYLLINWRRKLSVEYNELC